MQHNMIVRTRMNNQAPWFLPEPEEVFDDLQRQVIEAMMQRTPGYSSERV